jgi:UDP-N-acetylmuramyl tripeptide synthase
VSQPTPARLSAYDRVCIGLGLAAGRLSRATGRGGGGTVPGRVVLALRPKALQTLTAHRPVLLVSGTNGKSTTTRLLTAAMGEEGSVLSNGDGGNLLGGLVGAFLADPRGTSPAVLEVDEVVLPAALAQTKPDVVVLLNLSRDQLDRVGEVASHVDRWARALAAHPAVHVVANSDDPLIVSAVRTGRPADDRVTWVAAGSPWRSDSSLCPVCGHGWSLTAEPWGCSQCGLAAPPSDWTRGAERELIGSDGSVIPLQLSLPGRASAANAVMAAAAAHVVGVPVQLAIERARQVRDIDGRYLRVQVRGREVQLLLAKNPAGWLEVLSELTTSAAGLVLGINARTADGTDPSWLWDVPFEQLRGRRIVVFGERALDLSVRLHYADVEHVVEPDIRKALAVLDGVPVQLAANYTAFVAARLALRGAAA